MADTIARHSFQKQTVVSCHLLKNEQSYVYSDGLFRNSLEQTGMLFITFILLDKNFLEQQSHIDEDCKMVLVKRAKD